jgi:hypothetical protein
MTKYPRPLRAGAAAFGPSELRFLLADLEVCAFESTTPQRGHSSNSDVVGAEHFGH